MTFKNVYLPVVLFRIEAATEYLLAALQRICSSFSLKFFICPVKSDSENDHVVLGDQSLIDNLGLTKILLY